jgi:hypothetical protein
LLGGDKSAQWTVGTNEMTLSNYLIKGSRPQQFGKWCNLPQALGDGIIKQRRSSRPFGGL